MDAYFCVMSYVCVLKKNHVDANCFDVNLFHIYMVKKFTLMLIVLMSNSFDIYMVVGVFRINELNDGCNFFFVMAYLG